MQKLKINCWLKIFLLISIIIIFPFFYIPTSIEGVDEIYHQILLPLATGYISAYIFYYITVFIPQKNRYEKAKEYLDTIRTGLSLDLNNLGWILSGEKNWLKIDTNEVTAKASKIKTKNYWIGRCEESLNLEGKEEFIGYSKIFVLHLISQNLYKNVEKLNSFRELDLIELDTIKKFKEFSEHPITKKIENIPQTDTVEEGTLLYEELIEYIPRVYNGIKGYENYFKLLKCLHVLVEPHKKTTKAKNVG